MIFIDSNIPMYLIGAEHPNKREAQVWVERFIIEKRRMVVSTEVFQEIMHRYVAIDRKDDIPIAFDTLYGIIDEVFLITEEDIQETKNLILNYSKLSARDALHAALMKRLRIKDILTFDQGFDQLEFLHRLPD